MGRRSRRAQIAQIAQHHPASLNDSWRVKPGILGCSLMAAWSQLAWKAFLTFLEELEIEKGTHFTCLGNLKNIDDEILLYTCPGHMK